MKVFFFLGIAPCLRATLFLFTAASLLLRGRHACLTESLLEKPFVLLAASDEVVLVSAMKA